MDFNFKDIGIGAAIGAIAGVALGVVYSNEIKEAFASKPENKPDQAKPATAEAKTDAAPEGTQQQGAEHAAAA